MTTDKFDSAKAEEYAEKAYLIYAMMTVKDRALPQAQDGQKPVQKRILYAMWEDRLFHDAKHVKSAKVVGAVLGNYHPHGDQACYQAMVRMAQPFSLRYPLIDGQGNFGSNDGDSAAAQRYTECRLSRYAELLLAEVHSGTVPFIPNYDGEKTEPMVLPARLPFTLLNGGSGIAVGMKCDLPAHNLTEIGAACKAAMDNPKIDLDEVLQFVPGPDFATGGQIISSAADIRRAYAEGYGSVRVRCRWTIENLARGQWQAVITEFPPECSAKSVLQDLDALANPQPKKAGDKPTQEQLTLKQLTLSLIDAAKDESDKDTPVRLVIAPKTAKVDKDELMAFLFARTGLETSVPINLTVVGNDGRPETKTFLGLLKEWAEFRITCVTNRTKTRLAQIEARLHILAGRVQVLLNLEEVIETIRDSDDPKIELVRKFDLSGAQADDILEIRLRQLARLEGFKLEKEINELTAERKKLDRLLSDGKVMRKAICAEIQADIDKFGDARRTLVKEEKQVARTAAALATADEPITVFLSKNGLLKARAGHDLQSEFPTKPGDSLAQTLVARTTDTVVFLDSNGRAYSVEGHVIPSGRADWMPITALADLQNGGQILYGFVAGEGQILFAGKNGYGFVAEAKSTISRQKAGKAVLTLEKGESPMPPVPVSGEWLAVGSTEGKFLIYKISEVKEMDKGKGVMLMDLPEGASLSGLALFEGEPTSVGVSSVYRGKESVARLEDAAKHVLKRARKGAFLAKKAVFSGKITG